MIAVIFEVEPRDGARDAYLRIAHVVRDYGLNERDEAPVDSRVVHG